ncbi:hypothetical protein GA0111570_103127 [Raineyella antarctica]|uniref:Uncharacterized protein n=1 Tax=Raineyella antarctica TaxID=1577474 RepID=A0A1G6GFR5_9ACTN|nr:hypothetical protein [Raineyella antarctica]SDB80804.1 hypothetical protein GA0111570_103127 [Raineyella antarctica]
MAETSVVPSSVRRLRLTAIVATVLIVIQLGLGIMIATGNGGLREAHAGIGYLLVLTGIVASIFAWSAAKVAGSKGVFFHALSLPVLMLVQIGLAEMGLEVVHIILGILIVVAVVGLVPMAGKLAGRTAATPVA